MKKRHIFRQFMGLLLAMLMVLGTATAGTYDVSEGSVSVHATETDQTVTHGSKAEVSDPDPVITGTTTENNVIITADAGKKAHVTFEDLQINLGTNLNDAPVRTEGAGDVSIELEGDNSLSSAYACAGLQKENGGELVIGDEDDDGTLTAKGDGFSAGIGGGDRGEGSNITVNGGTVTATGGAGGGAGIGGGVQGEGSNITVNGGTVTANGGAGGGAGIGGGYTGNGSNITVNGGTVTATGRAGGGAGIGGGSGGEGSGITVNDGTVNATGGDQAAGIGGGKKGTGSGITVNDGTVNATGGTDGAGIGGGYKGEGSGIEVWGGEVTATGGTNGAGIGGGYDGNGSAITISGGDVTATGGGMAAGIGGGSGGKGSDITVNGGEVTATGGRSGAGIGGGYGGEGSGIQIDGGEVTATGGDFAAGIGGGAGESGSGITISGGEVTATGGYYGAGIGAGYRGAGSDITISGGNVAASGGTNGAGIGSGDHGYVDSIAISGSAQVKAAGGKGESDTEDDGAAVGYGNGAGETSGADIEINEQDLTCGSVEYYPAGTSVKDMKDGSVEPGKTFDNEDIDHDYHWLSNSEDHRQVCNYEGCMEEKDVGVHTWMEYGAADATCTEVGYKPGIKCSVCGYEQKEPETIPAAGHTMTATASKPATCTETGNSAYWYCSVCRQYFSDADGNNVIVKDSWIIPATGHTEVTDKAVEPTCTETGLTEGKHCSVCEEVLVKQETVRAKGHTEVKDAAVPATTESTGLTEGSHCSVCGAVIKEQQIVDKLPPESEPDPEPEPESEPDAADTVTVLLKVIDRTGNLTITFFSNARFKAESVNGDQVSGKFGLNAAGNIVLTDDANAGSEIRPDPETGAFVLEFLASWAEEPFVFDLSADDVNKLK